MFGQIQLIPVMDDSKMPQEIASAWAGVNWAELTGCGYKFAYYYGPQQVNGILHWVMAEQTTMGHPITRHYVKMAILEENVKGEKTYKVMKDSIKIIL